MKVSPRATTAQLDGLREQLQAFGKVSELRPGLFTVEFDKPSPVGKHNWSKLLKTSDLIEFAAPAYNRGSPSLSFPAGDISVMFVDDPEGQVESFAKRHNLSGGTPNRREPRQVSFTASRQVYLPTLLRTLDKDIGIEWASPRTLSAPTLFSPFSQDVFTP